VVPPIGSSSQSFRASGLSLITAAIVHWNTVYLDRAVQQLRLQGAAVPDDLLAHVAPLGWEQHRRRQRRGQRSVAVPLLAKVHPISLFWGIRGLDDFVGALERGGGDPVSIAMVGGVADDRVARPRHHLLAPGCRKRE
jgi:Tn3 transposase DDE domain